MSLGLVLKAAGLRMVIVNDPEARGTHSEIELEHLLKVVGLKLFLVDDRETLAKRESMYEPRDAAQVRLGDAHWRRGRKK
jgi:hypothetical protein